MSSRTQRLLDDGDEPATYTSWSGSSSSATTSDSFLTRLRLNHNKLLTYICVGLILVAVIVIGFIAVAIRREESGDENANPRYASTDECVISHSPHSRPVHRLSPPVRRHDTSAAHPELHAARRTRQRL